jgi:hypothetical protein
MTEPLKAPRRKNRFNIFKEAERLGSFDEYPLLTPEVDPQVHLSNNSVDQPFFLVCEKDSVLTQFGGSARVVLQQGAVRYADLGPGDYLYIPGGIPHRILTTAPGEQLRYKARDPGKEGVEWYCENCGELADRFVWDTKTTPSQAGYLAGTLRWNHESDRRRCGRCGRAHEPIDLSPFRWEAIVLALAATEAEEDF